MISVIAVTTFLITSFVALVWANGLTFNPTDRNFQQTAVIAVEARVTDAAISVNDRQISTLSPIQERGLPPGQYTLRISKLGYADYVKTFQLSVGQVGIVPQKVKLLALSPRIVSGQSNRTYSPLNSYEVGLAVENGELTDKGVLVTRFGTDPELVRYFNDGYLYQMGTELRLYFPDNASDVLIRTLSANTPAALEVNQSDWSVTLFEVDGTATTLYLTEPSES